MLRGIDHVDYAALEVCQGGDGLHLDRVHFLELMVEDPGGVDDLEAEVVVVGVADVEGLGCEGVGLHFDVGSTDAVDEARLTDVGVAGQENGPFVRVDCG